MAHVAGASLNALSAKFSTPQRRCSRDSIHRHFRDHVDEALRASYLADVPLAELSARAAAEGMSLLDYFGLIQSTVVQQMLIAAGVNDGHRTAVLAGRAVEVLKEIGRLSGELTRLGTTISVTKSRSSRARNSWSCKPGFSRSRASILTPAPTSSACSVASRRQRRA